MAIAGLKATVSHSMRSDSSNGCSPGTPLHDQNDSRLPDLLRHARECRGLSLEQLANDTKIPASRLAAFEHDELTGKDIGFYLRAQIRAYARALHLDERVVLAELNRGSAPAPMPAPSRVPVAEAETRQPVWRIPRAPVAFGLVIAAVVAGRVIATLQFSTAGDADRGTESAASSLEREAPVPTGTTAADIPSSAGPRSESVASGLQPARDLDDGATSLESARPAALELQALRASEDPGPSRGIAPTEPVDGSAPTTSVTELVITSDPPGARVTVNGIGWGATPIAIRHLSAGPKRIRVTKDGYVAVERVVSVGPNRSSRVAIQLRTP